MLGQPAGVPEPVRAAEERWPLVGAARHNRSVVAGATLGAMRGVSEWRLVPGRTPLTRGSAGLPSWSDSALATQILLRWFIAIPPQIG